MALNVKFQKYKCVLLFSFYLLRFTGFSYYYICGYFRIFPVHFTLRSCLQKDVLAFAVKLHKSLHSDKFLVKEFVLLTLDFIFY